MWFSVNCCPLLECKYTRCTNVFLLNDCKYNIKYVVLRNFVDIFIFAV